MPSETTGVNCDKLQIFIWHEKKKVQVEQIQKVWSIDNILEQ